VTELPVRHNWAREALDSTLDEARSFVRTAVAFARRPGLFMEEWEAGTASRMNPLGFFATSLAIVGACGQLDRFWPSPGESKPSIVGDALESAGPYLHAAVLALLVHAVLRSRGSRRPLLDSVAAALYACGIAQVAATLLLACIQAGFRRPIAEVAQSSVGIDFVAVAILGPAVFFAVALVVALSGLHRMPRRFPALALALAWILTGAILSWVNPPGRWGLHLVFGASTSAFSSSANVGLGL
jgi:hypothetical protein